MASDPRTTRELLEFLPQELWDRIYHITFTIPADSLIRIDDEYTPPSTMQVDRATRAAFAPGYYANNNNIFVLAYPDLAKNFALSFDYHHREFFRYIKVVVSATRAESRPFSVYGWGDRGAHNRTRKAFTVWTSPLWISEVYGEDEVS